MTEFTAAQLREFLGKGELLGDPERRIQGVAPPQEAGEGHLTFIFAKKWLKALPEIKASIVVLPLLEGIHPPEYATYIMVENVGEAMIKLLCLFVTSPFSRERGISPQAYVSPKATVKDGAVIYPFAFVDDDVLVGEGAVIMPYVFVGREARIGAGAVLMPSVVVYPGVEVGENTVVHGGAVLGADGFGYGEFQGRRIKIPQVGGVRIGRDVEIGANACVDRATMGFTVVEEGTKLDNLVQVAHNVKIGRHCAFAAQVGISGSAIVGDRVLMGGQVGVADHAHIGDGAILAAKAGVMGKVPPGAVLTGAPAIPHRLWKKVQVWHNRLPQLAERVKALEKALEEMRSGAHRDSEDS
jgi:UDP-3-O-[3-hydroxymyristoyl] glucosamine N-acyltransferase